MPIIELITTIYAPIKRCFDLSRSIDLHTGSTSHTGEKAVSGVTSGLIGEGEKVTWRAKHFGIWQYLTSRISAFDPPLHFRDAMVRGAFQHIHHDHYFEQQGDQTLMRDVFDYAAPLGILGRLVEQFVLTHYLRRLLERRNAFIKQIAESDQWRQYLPAETL
jgi:ligand-binding SRPBCC domain-containing protein